ncbi:MAG: hypothetical protein ACHQX3_00695 [Nitrospirales bacterium]
MEIWVVTVGSYSDMSVDSLFTSVEAAEAYAEEMNRRNESYGQTYRVDCHLETDPPLPSIVEAIVREPARHNVTITSMLRGSDCSVYYYGHCYTCGAKGALATEESANRWKEQHERQESEL